MSEFQVDKQQINTCRVVEDCHTDENTKLNPEEILLKVDAFAFTANNITYAVAGDSLGYWQFFPASDNQPGNWGIIPVWGFAIVVMSNHPDVAVGERLFGYFPPASYLKMTATNISKSRLVDGSSHRSKLPAGYNTYRRLGMNRNHDDSNDNAQMLLWPLHATSFCLWDKMQDNGWFDAQQVIIISASSKTSIGLAYALERDPQSPTCIGLTSTVNSNMVEALNIYDAVVSYNDLSELNSEQRTLIVDMSGNAALLARLEDSLGEQLVYTIKVGITHWDELNASSMSDSPNSEFFFAPSHIQQRIAQWGPQEFEKRSTEFINYTTQKCHRWLKIKTLYGLEQLSSQFERICNGKIPPDEGIVVRL